MKTAIVHGPVGCGKTSHAHIIARLLGIPETNIIDGWDGHRRSFRFGHLHLTTEGEMQHMAGGPDIILRSFDSFNFPRFDPPPRSMRDLGLGVIAAEIIGERLRQIDKLGYDAAHDDDHHHGEIAAMAGAYALLSAAPDDQEKIQLELWPWEDPMPTHHDRRDLLITAAALIVAEIERLDRHAEKYADCTCLEVFGEDPVCKMHGRDTEWGRANPELPDTPIAED